MSNPLEVREFRPADAAEIAEASPSWASIMGPLLDAKSAGTGTTIVAFTDAQPVGLVELVWGEPACLVRNLHVLERFRGQGYGSELIRAAERAAAPAPTVRLAVGVDNPQARRLYERLGYRPTGEQQTVTYSYIDAMGVARTATETSDFLEKALRPLHDRASGRGL